MKKAQILSFFLSILIFLLWISLFFHKSYHFKVNFLEPLESAIELGSASITKERLKQAITYLKKEGMIYGHTSIFWETPDENVGTFYDRIMELSDSLNKSEKIFLLLKKIRTEIPRGIYFFPHNKTIAWLPTSAVFFLIVGLFWNKLSLFFVYMNEKIEKKLTIMENLNC